MEEQAAEHNYTDVVIAFPKRDPLYIVIPMTILYSVIFFTGVTGNVITCIVIARNKHMHTATNYYLFSLAISDLLLLVSGLPQEMYYIWSRYPYIFGEAFCLLRGLASETSANATILTITAFTVERYVAICHPFLAHTMSKLSRAVKFILTIWIIALAFAIPQALQFGVVYGDDPDNVQCMVKRVLIEHSFELSTFLFFLTPMTLITVLYALIGLRLRRSALLKKSSGSFSSHQQDVSRKGTSCRNQSSRRVLKMLVAVVVAFFICWAPFHAQRLVAIYGTTDSDTPASPFMLTVYAIVTYTSGILYYVSTTVNPILYHIMSLKFREAFKDSLSRCCCLKGRRRSYAMLSRQHRGTMGCVKQQAAESVTDSGNSGVGGGVYQQSQYKKRHASESSYIMNESEIRIPMETVKVASIIRTTSSSDDIKDNMNNRKNILSLYCVACVDKDNKKKNQINTVYHNEDAMDTKLGREVETRYCRRFSVSSNNISNSSLKDVDRSALQDELSAYMVEISNRQF